MDPRLDLVEVAAHATRVERLGYDGLHVAETVHDAMTVATLAVEHTDRIVVRTSVALAFVRSPTLLAYTAWDLSRLSGGRFELGLGTQIRQNIEDRYAVPFGEDPVGRLGDYVGAVRASFAAFASGEAPRYESALPAHTHAAVLQPRARHRHGGAADLPRGCAASCLRAGRRRRPRVRDPSDQLEPSLPGRAVPARADRGCGAPGRDLRRDGFELVVGTSVVTGRTHEAVQAERERQRRLLAFLYSTPAYAPTLELYGWDDLGPRLRDLVRHDRWDDLGRVLSDEVLDELVPSGTFDELPDLVLERFAELGQGITIGVPADPADDDAFRAVVAAIRQG